MFSARALGRVVARSARITPTLSRPALAVPRRAILQSTPAWKPTSLRAFSTSIGRFEKQGTVDEELSIKLESELQLELEMAENEEDPVPLSIKEFMDSSPFKINDQPGQEQVELVRKFGDETIRVSFSIADINNIDNENLNDHSLFDDQHSEDGQVPASSDQSGGAQSVQAKREGRVASAEDPAAEEEFGEEEEEEDISEESFPARVQVTIEKPNQGALQIDAVAQDGMIVVDNVFFLKNANLASARTAEADWERRGVYAGPPFSNLDEDLQVLLERYLDERGINTSLALFVPDYIDYKEQKEYLSWLENLKGFVDA
ncbi:mitochondrial glyco protein [Ascodesmis nigricans]|uniref:Mitochondrial glyco protein n=1 Tax=Ascodesmis nigricans TaxID=341454 RepID=A0A4S2MXA8_9PEZI|nr:mitochondrial glyco protein [Ascodesmis nigricans]